MNLTGKKYAEIIIKMPEEWLDVWLNHLRRLEECIPFHEKKVYLTHLKEFREGEDCD